MSTFPPLIRYESALQLEIATGDAARQSGPLADWQIDALIQSGKIECFDPEPQIDHTRTAPYPGLTWGITHKGLDLRINHRIRRPNPKYTMGISPRIEVGNLPPDLYLPWEEIAEGQTIDLDPGEAILAETKEWISIPDFCSGEVMSRSTNLRLFVLLADSPLEAGWRGRITLEVKNDGRFRVGIRPHTGFCQVQFSGGGVTRFPYKGKYQDQDGPTPPRMLK